MFPAVKPCDGRGNRTRIEDLFTPPDFHRTHATQTGQLTAGLAAAKENLAKLYARWEELEAIKAASEK